MNWAEEDGFIPRPHWPWFKVWVACGGVLVGHYLIGPALLWVLQ